MDGGVCKGAATERKVIRPGARFGKLTCIEQKNMEEEGTSVTAWRCRCACGNEIIVREALLRCGVKSHCGCQGEKARDLTGRQFGRLTALDPLPDRCTDGSICWICRCSCGKFVHISSNKLLTGHTQSCGCYQEEKRGDGRTFVDGTCLENIASTKRPKNNTSGRKGVSRSRNRWAAYITYAKKQYALGRYESIEEATAVREGAERLRWAFAMDRAEGLEAASDFQAVLREYLHKDCRAPEPARVDTLPALAQAMHS